MNILQEMIMDLWNNSSIIGRNMNIKENKCNDKLTELNKMQQTDIEIKIRQFIMQRIHDIETEKQRKLYVEPDIIEELQYYITRSWLLDKEQMTQDLQYLKMSYSDVVSNRKEA